MVDAVASRRRENRWLLPRHGRDVIRLLVGTFVLVLSAVPVEVHSVTGPEESVFRIVNGLPGFLFPLLWVLMQLGNLVAVPLAALAAAALRRWRLSFDLAAAGMLAYVLAKVAKRIVERGRPSEVLDDVILHGAAAVGHGYLSGHAALAAALATAASPYLSPRQRALAWGTAAIVMVGRVYTGAHLPLDVVGGAALGWALAALVHVIFGAPEPTRASPREHGSR